MWSITCPECKGARYVGANLLCPVCNGVGQVFVPEPGMSRTSSLRLAIGCVMVLCAVLLAWAWIYEGGKP